MIYCGPIKLVCYVDLLGVWDARWYLDSSGELLASQAIANA